MRRISDSFIAGQISNLCVPWVNRVNGTGKSTVEYILQDSMAKTAAVWTGTNDRHALRLEDLGKIANRHGFSTRGSQSTQPDERGRCRAPVPGMGASGQSKIRPVSIVADFNLTDGGKQPKLRPAE
jgi:hypothetical protein